MNRSHKHQLESLKAKNSYSKDDLELAKELLNQEDPPFHEEVVHLVEKISTILKIKEEENKKS